MYLLNPWADECWWDESAWLHDWGWDTLLDQGFWDKLLQGLSGARGAWALVHGLERGCSWEPPPPPPLWKCEERREERELVPQPDIPRRIKNCFKAFSFVKKRPPTKHFQTGFAANPNPIKFRELVAPAFIFVFVLASWGIQLSEISGHTNLCARMFF